MNNVYVNTLANIYNSGTSIIRLDNDSYKFPIQREVRQGDTLSPKLFNAGLEQVFRRLNWEDKGIKINGEMLNYLRFADDIVLIGKDGNEIESMINELNEESCKLGMKINMKKTKVMYNSNAAKTRVQIGTHEVEQVDDYVYLGQLVTMKNDKTDEIKRRISVGWGGFSKYRDIMRSKVLMCLKRKVYSQCIQPAMTYGCQTWVMTKRMETRLRTTQRSMESNDWSQQANL